jgi:hypothetical protein
MPATMIAAENTFLMRRTLGFSRTNGELSFCSAMIMTVSTIPTAQAAPSPG